MNSEKISKLFSSVCHHLVFSKDIRSNVRRFLESYLRAKSLLYGYMPYTVQWINIVAGGDSVHLLRQQFPRTVLPLHACRVSTAVPAVLWKVHGAIDFKENLCEFSVDSFRVIIYGKLLRYHSIFGSAFCRILPQRWIRCNNCWPCLYGVAAYANEREYRQMELDNHRHRCSNACCAASATGFVGDWYDDASDGVSSLLRHELSRVHRTAHHGADSSRQGLPVAARLYRADGHNLGDSSCRLQSLHRRL